MNGGSLQLRLLAAATVSIVIALVLSGIFIGYIFERYVTARIESELISYNKQLAASMAFADDGTPKLASNLAEPRFERPLSGLYWQIASGDEILLRSRSLWHYSLTLPASRPLDVLVRETPEDMPAGEPLAIVQSDILIFNGSTEQRYRLTSAIDLGEITRARKAFDGEIFLALVMVGVALMAAAGFQATVGLSPLRKLRRTIATIREGNADRLDGEFPDEVRPLVEEINTLLASQEEAVKRARYSAADLAHGLKTPLSIISAESRRLASTSSQASTVEIQRQIEIMRRKTDRHLALARLRGRGGLVAARAKLGPTLGGLIRTMQCIPAQTNIDWTYPKECELDVAIDADDLTEALGNILDNARKWASSRVEISISADKATIVVTITDDGPGPQAPVDALIERSITAGRPDLTGEGIGLAISREILEAYGGLMQLGASTSGGMMVSVRLPTTNSAHPVSAIASVGSKT